MNERITSGDNHLEENIGKLISCAEPRLTMPELSKTSVLSTLLEGASAAPPTGRVATARATVARPASAWHRTFVQRSWMRGAVAALIALFAGASFLLFHQPSSAADELRDVIKANDAYRGWVHVTMKGNGGRPRSSERTVHFNTVDQTMAIIDGQGQARRIQFFSQANATWSSYDGQQIVLGDLGDGRAIREQSHDIPLTWSEFSALLAPAMDDTSTVVNYSRDEALDRFTLILDIKKPGADTPIRMTVSVWADPETRLIQMISASTAEPDGRGIFTSTYRYGEPAVADIYAAGAPKDARVVDRRTTKDTATLVQQIRAAIQADLGDYVAILTRSKMKDGRLRTEGGMRLELLAKRGQSMAMHMYWVGKRDPYTASWMHVIPTPEGWPDPDIQTVLKALGQYNPARGTLFDGTTITGYAPDPDRQAFHTRSTKLASESELAVHTWEYMLPARAFGSSLSMYTIAGPGTTFESLPMDTGRAGLQGLRVSIEQPTGDKPSRLEADIWCDPTKGLVPVEFVVQSARGRETAVTVENRVFTEFATLGSGWFAPRVWQETNAQSGDTFECHLIVSQEQVVDETWLSLPKYLPDQRPEQ